MPVSQSGERLLVALSKEVATLVFLGLSVLFLAGSPDPALAVKGRLNFFHSCSALYPQETPRPVVHYSVTSCWCRRSRMCSVLHFCIPCTDRKHWNATRWLRFWFWRLWFRQLCDRQRFRFESLKCCFVTAFMHLDAFCLGRVPSIKAQAGSTSVTISLDVLAIFLKSLQTFFWHVWHLCGICWRLLEIYWEK